MSAFQRAQMYSLADENIFNIAVRGMFDDAQDIVYQSMRLAMFYAHESCAQCTQCREGTAWTVKILERLLKGEGKPADLDLLMDLGENMTGKTICVLSDSCAAPVMSGRRSSRP